MFGKFGKYHPDEIRSNPAVFDLIKALRDDLDLVAKDDRGAHRLTFATGIERQPVKSDREHLRLIVVNLLQNAVKYSAPGSEVQLRVEVAGPHVRIAVSDAGIGIPKAEIEELFSPFYRASNVAERPGSGLGLAVVKQSARIIGAQIEVDSRLDEGTTFTITLQNVIR